MSLLSRVANISETRDIQLYAGKCRMLSACTLEQGATSKSNMPIKIANKPAPANAPVTTAPSSTTTPVAVTVPTTTVQTTTTTATTLSATTSATSTSKSTAKTSTTTLVSKKQCEDLVPPCGFPSRDCITGISDTSLRARSLVLRTLERERMRARKDLGVAQMHQYATGRHFVHVAVRHIPSFFFLRQLLRHRLIFAPRGQMHHFSY
jgi:hypothetical protein